MSLFFLIVVLGVLLFFGRNKKSSPKSIEKTGHQWQLSYWVGYFPLVLLMLLGVYAIIVKVLEGTDAILVVSLFLLFLYPLSMVLFFIAGIFLFVNLLILYKNRNKLLVDQKPHVLRYGVVIALFVLVLIVFGLSQSLIEGDTGPLQALLFFVLIFLSVILAVANYFLIQSLKYEKKMPEHMIADKTKQLSTKKEFKYYLVGLVALLGIISYEIYSYKENQEIRDEITSVLSEGYDSDETFRGAIDYLVIHHRSDDTVDVQYTIRQSIWKLEAVAEAKKEGDQWILVRSSFSGPPYEPRQLLQVPLLTEDNLDRLAFDQTSFGELLQEELGKEMIDLKSPQSHPYYGYVPSHEQALEAMAKDNLGFRKFSMGPYFGGYSDITLFKLTSEGIIFPTLVFKLNRPLEEVSLEGLSETLIGKKVPSNKEYPTLFGTYHLLFLDSKDKNKKEILEISFANGNIQSADFIDKVTVPIISPFDIEKNSAQYEAMMKPWPHRRAE